jgi:hypothetical protein
MVTDFGKYFKDMAKYLLVIAIISIVAGCCVRLNAQYAEGQEIVWEGDSCLGSGISLARDVYVIDTAAVQHESRWMRFVVWDTIRGNYNTMDDTVWGYKLGDYVHYNRIEMGRRMNNGIKYNKKAEQNFWAGTGCLAGASAFYIAAAWSDPVVYVESTKRFTWDYYHDAKFKRDVLIGGGVIMTGLATYFYYKSYQNGKKSRWMISPNGVRYNF